MTPYLFFSSFISLRLSHLPLCPAHICFIHYRNPRAEPSAGTH